MGRTRSPWSGVTHKDGKDRVTSEVDPIATGIAATLMQVEASSPAQMGAARTVKSIDCKIESGREGLSSVKV